MEYMLDGFYYDYRWSKQLIACEHGTLTTTTQRMLYEKDNY